ncbi:MAG: DedA family protein [Bacteriovorax sp.]|nr:DedA family protein [Bacteriovorax sp.]
MFPTDAHIMQFFAQYAHSPAVIYSIVAAMMFLSSFGLPLPEEVTILALGIMVHMGKHPDQYPPPPGVVYQPLHVFTAMTVCFFSIMISDFIVYYIGKRFGASPFVHKLFRRFLGENSLERSRTMIHKHRFLVPAIFRFTPGIRFPGHLSCGMMGISTFTFLMADGLAALISVPTQVYVFAKYGEVILSTIKEIKHYALIITAVLVAAYLIYKLKQKVFGKKESAPLDPV